MVFQEWYYDDDWEESDFIDHDNTREDGFGYCDRFEKNEEGEKE